MSPTIPRRSSPPKPMSDEEVERLHAETIDKIWAQHETKIKPKSDPWWKWFVRLFRPKF